MTRSPRTDVNVRSGRGPAERKGCVLAEFNHLLEFFLSLLLHPPDVLHGQTHPFVDPAEQLAVEVGENTLFLLWKEEEEEELK